MKDDGVQVTGGEGRNKGPEGSYFVLLVPGTELLVVSLWNDLWEGLPARACRSCCGPALTPGPSPNFWARGAWQGGLVSLSASGVGAVSAHSIWGRA